MVVAGGVPLSLSPFTCPYCHSGPPIPAFLWSCSGVVLHLFLRTIIFPVFPSVLVCSLLYGFLIIRFQLGFLFCLVVIVFFFFFHAVLLFLTFNPYLRMFSIYLLSFLLFPDSLD